MKNYRGKRHFTKEVIEEVAAKSGSKREMLIGMELPTGGTYGYRVLNFFVDLYQVDIKHFEGRERAAKLAAKNAIPLSDILSGLHPQYATNHLKKRLLKLGIFTHQCAMCKNTKWMDKPIPLDLDHINGKSWDHKSANLRLLCRNCHAQTDNFCGKNMGKV